jgi:hypothetical protein
MDGKRNERGDAWLGYALQEGIKHGLTDAREILAHATPEVLVAQLPPQLTTQLIAGSLKTGKLTPDSVLEVAPPYTLAKNLEPAILWSCLSDAAEAANLVSVGGTASAAGRRWMGSILQHGIDQQLITPEDVVRHVPPVEWVKDAPPNVLTDMLAAGLSQGVFNAKLALVHLTPEVAAENCSPPLLWSCIAEAVSKAFNLHDAGTQASQTLQKATAQLDKQDKSNKERAAADKERAERERAERERAERERADRELRSDRHKIESKTKLEPVVVKGAAVTKPLPDDAESWENVVMPVSDDEVVEETSPGPPEPPRAAARPRS